MDTVEMMSKIKDGETYISNQIGGGGAEAMVAIGDLDTIRFEYCSGDGAAEINLKRNWKKVRKALSFYELLEKIENGDLVTLKHSGLIAGAHKESYIRRPLEAILEMLSKSYVSEFIARILLECEFYIEGD